MNGTEKSFRWQKRKDIGQRSRQLLQKLTQSYDRLAVQQRDAARSNTRAVGVRTLATALGRSTSDAGSSRTVNVADDGFGATTVTSLTRRDSTAGARKRRVRWVFPEQRMMSLVESQSIGRDPECSCQLLGKEISRRHAEFRVDGPLLALFDLGSRNGICVNGRRRDAGPIFTGDVIRCGEWIGVVADEADDGGFRDLGSGWFGGSTLANAVVEGLALPSEIPVVIEGETGTGKECAARAIHARSGRTGELVAVNCAALPEQLVESTLFGHRKGAFTGADKASQGCFRAAHGGTLFLDELQELPLAVQPKLLRALEMREVVPVGETAPVPVDVRVVVASQDPLEALVAEGKLRPDLQARIEGYTMRLPALRERREDVVPLFLHFLALAQARGFPEIEPRLAEAISLYDWPLNVRELLWLARRLVAIHGRKPLLLRDYLPSRLQPPKESAPDGAGESAPAQRVLRPAEGAVGDKRAWRPSDDEREFGALVRALKEHRGNVSRAAASIGIHRGRAYRILAAHPEFIQEDP